MNKGLMSFLAVAGVLVGLGVGYFAFSGGQSLGAVTPSNVLNQQRLVNEFTNGLAPLTSMLVAAPTIDFGSLATGTTTQLTATTSVTGAATGDFVIVSAATPSAGAVFTGAVTATNVVTVYYTNVATSTTDPASSVFNIRVLPAASFAVPTGL